jgi:hypothetical protein
MSYVHIRPRTRNSKENSPLQGFSRYALQAVSVSFVRAYCLSLLVAGLTLWASSCASKQEETSKQASAEQQTVKEKPHYYKVKEVSLAPTIDAAMEKQGQQIFDVTCTSCHKYDERYVGPALGSVTQRRTPEFIMNMILDTETMIEHDDTVRCMLQEYLLKMPNMQVNEHDARAVLEHLRAHATKK